ncbi:MAG: hypothetical protein GC178_11175 [Flavobacteriales bacterium]|nr:hypothetical protein [Flavobacteriales bacterium]
MAWWEGRNLWLAVVPIDLLSGMRWSIPLIILASLLGGCKTTHKSVEEPVQKAEAPILKFPVTVKFRSEEAFKRGMFELGRFHATIGSEISSAEHIYQLFLSCREYEIDGIVEKLNDNPNIEWAKRSD